jgi:CrcB protein
VGYAIYNLYTGLRGSQAGGKMNIATVCAVAGGGALGAVARFVVVSTLGKWLAVVLPAAGMPWGTFLVNVIGSAIMGGLIEIMALHWSPSPELRAFLVVGFLGAFTTFSTFSLDIATLLQRGAYATMFAYGVASVACGLGGLFLGMKLVRALWPVSGL